LVSADALTYWFAGRLRPPVNAPVSLPPNAGMTGSLCSSRPEYRYSLTPGLVRIRETYTTGRAPSDSARTPEDGCNW
jgi:hypothetical protein